MESRLASAGVVVVVHTHGVRENGNRTLGEYEALYSRGSRVGGTLKIITLKSLLLECFVASRVWCAICLSWRGGRTWASATATADFVENAGEGDELQPRSSNRP